MNDPYVAHGHITISQQLFERTKANEDAFREMEWIGWHYNEATPEQREKFDAWQQHMAEIPDDYWDDDD